MLTTKRRKIKQLKKNWSDLKKVIENELKEKGDLSLIAEDKTWIDAKWILYILKNVK